MLKVFLRKLKLSDKPYFATWWRDPALLCLSGLAIISALLPVLDAAVSIYSGHHETSFTT